MKFPVWTYWVAVALAEAVGGAAEPASRLAGVAGGPTSRPAASGPAEKAAVTGAKALLIEPDDPTAVPITLPTVVRPSTGDRRPLLPVGVMVINRITTIEKDPTGKWRTIKDPRVGRLYLLPCKLLETVEEAQAENPAGRFSLCGEVHRYRGGYYMLLRRAILLAPEAASQPASKPVAAATRTEHQPAGQSPTATKTAEPKNASADEIARELLRQTPGKPIVPNASPPKTPTRTIPSGAPAGKPLRPGPGKTAIDRLVRLLPRPDAAQWFRLAFEADNTLREPPLRILPNVYLERMETLSRDGRAFGVVFGVSGEMHHYRGHDYILLRTAIKKRNLGQF